MEQQKQHKQHAKQRSPLLKMYNAFFKNKIRTYSSTNRRIRYDLTEHAGSLHSSFVHPRLLLKPQWVLHNTEPISITQNGTIVSGPSDH